MSEVQEKYESLTFEKVFKYFFNEECYKIVVVKGDFNDKTCKKLITSKIIDNIVFCISLVYKLP